MAKVRVVLHHVPNDRTVSDGDHGLRDIFGIITQPEPESAAEQHDLHSAILSLLEAASRRTLKRQAWSNTGAGPEKRPFFK